MRPIASGTGGGGIVGPVAFKILKLLVGFNLILKVLKFKSDDFIRYLAVIWDAGGGRGNQLPNRRKFLLPLMGKGVPFSPWERELDCHGLPIFMITT